MNNRTQEESELQELAALKALLGSLKQAFPGASVSIKAPRIDRFGDLRPALTCIDEKGSAACWLETLTRGLELADLAAEEERFLLSAERVDAGQPQPGEEIFLHAALPARVVAFTACEEVLSLSSAEIGRKLLADAFPGMLVPAVFAAGTREQARAAAAAWKDGLWGVILPHRGLLLGGASPREVSDRLAEIRKKSEYLLKSKDAWNTSVSLRPQTGLELGAAAQLRKQISNQAGAPVIVRWTKASGWTPEPAENHLLVQSLAYLQPYSVVADERLGAGFAGGDAEQAGLALSAFELEQRIAQRATALGKVDWLEDVPSAAVAPLPGQAAVMRGEVALVTGAASGIGKACVMSFLARGAAVVGLDVNPAIATMLERPDFLGIPCDLTNEEALRSALAQVVQTFGGLDMLVLNAGIFPSSKRIEALQLADFERVLRINLDANLNLLREAHPLLLNAPKGGRVVANASRNALAPGPGAAAYSVSKMALTQLARVAALEWGAEGIRVNVVHPDSVFDTGVWSDEVLKARAANYHMTVEDYKRRNVMKSELTSRDISEMIVEMCGPLFAKVTGAQLPVDGGSDRVI